MEPIPQGDDRWRGHCSFAQNAQFELTIEAWGDAFLSWQHEFATKFKAALPDLTSETLEGAALVAHAAARAAALGHAEDSKRLLGLAQEIRAGSGEVVYGMSHFPELEALMLTYPDLSETTEYCLEAPSVRALVETPPLPRSVPRYPIVTVDRKLIGNPFLRTHGGRGRISIAG